MTLVTPSNLQASFHQIPDTEGNANVGNVPSHRLNVPSHRLRTSQAFRYSL